MRNHCAIVSVLEDYPFPSAAGGGPSATPMRTATGPRRLDWDSELSVYLAPEHQGRGWARRSTARFGHPEYPGLCQHLWHRLVPNPPSERLHEGLGFLVYTDVKTGWKLAAGWTWPTTDFSCAHTSPRRTCNARSRLWIRAPSWQSARGAQIGAELMTKQMQCLLDAAGIAYRTAEANTLI